MSRVESALLALKSLTRKPRGLEEQYVALTSLSESDDATVVLTCCGVVEETLQELLAAVMVDLTNPERSELFKGTGLLSTFSARTKIAYALGLFGKRTRHNLDLIREIRNGFAHSRAPLNFETPEVKDVCALLDIETTVHGGAFEWPMPIESKMRFIIATITLHGLLGTERFARRKPPVPLLP